MLFGRSGGGIDDGRFGLTSFGPASVASMKSDSLMSSSLSAGRRGVRAFFGISGPSSTAPLSHGGACVTAFFPAGAPGAVATIGGALDARCASSCGAPPYKMSVGRFNIGSGGGGFTDGGRSDFFVGAIP